MLHSRKTKWLLGTFAAGLVATGALTAYAFNTIFARPGEAALRLVPSEAMMVVSVDLSPSPQQALLFKKIDDSLAKHDLLDAFNGSPIDMLSDSAVAQKIKPHALRSGAFAMLKPLEENGEPRMLGFIGLNDPGRVTEILRKEAKPFFFRGTRAWKFDGESPMYVSVFENVMAVAGDTKDLHLVEQVADGAAPSIQKHDGYLAARKQVDADANVMVAFSPEMVSMMTAQFGADSGPALTHWSAMSLALRDGGIAMAMNGDIDGAKIPGYSKLAATPALRADLYEVLPDGAYGMIAMSSPASIYDFFAEMMKDSEEFEEGLDTFRDELQTNMGMDFDQDLVGSMRGNMVLALYPTAGKSGGIDALALIDDHHGSDPGRLVAKFMETMEEQARQGGEDNPFTKSEKDGVVRYMLDAGLAEEMQAEMDLEGDVVDADLLFGDKTVAMAVVGKSVLIASSEKMLERGIASLQTKQSPLKQDAAWGPYLGEVGENQYLLGFSLSRIAEGVRATLRLDKMSEDERKPAEEAINAFAGLKEPLFARAWQKTDRFSTTMFIPMDYEKMIDLLVGLGVTDSSTITPLKNTDGR